MGAEKPTVGTMMGSTSAERRETGEGVRDERENNGTRAPRLRAPRAIRRAGADVAPLRSCPVPSPPATHRR
jgi:hypothetical protein